MAVVAPELVLVGVPVEVAVPVWVCGEPPPVAVAVPVEVAEPESLAWAWLLFEPAPPAPPAPPARLVVNVLDALLVCETELVWLLVLLPELPVALFVPVCVVGPCWPPVSATAMPASASAAPTTIAATMLRLFKPFPLSN